VTHVDVSGAIAVVPELSQHEISTYLSSPLEIRRFYLPKEDCYGMLYRAPEKKLYVQIYNDKIICWLSGSKRLCDYIWYSFIMASKVKITQAHKKKCLTSACKACFLTYFFALNPNLKSKWGVLRADFE